MIQQHDLGRKVLGEEMTYAILTISVGEDDIKMCVFRCSPYPTPFVADHVVNIVVRDSLFILLIVGQPLPIGSSDTFLSRSYPGSSHLIITESMDIDALVRWLWHNVELSVGDIDIA